MTSSCGSNGAAPCALFPHGDWTNIVVERRECRGSAGELHALAMPKDGDTAQLWLMRPTDRSLVMGSAQKPELFDQQRLDADGVTLAGRRSGGGAVFIDPSAVVWIDVLAPRTSALWSPELTENFLIVGRVWQKALAACGVAGDLCVSSEQRTPAAALACWAGLGWGEITVGGAKVVGLSQRRTRWGARVQAMAVLDASSARVATYLPSEDQQIVTDSIPVGHTETFRAAGVSTASLEAAVLDAFDSLSTSK